MLKVIVTGGAGFIGSHLCERLVADGYDVLCVDNFCTGRPENVTHLLGKKFAIVAADVRNKQWALDIRFADAIYNLACPASPRYYAEHPIGTAQTCALGAVNVLDLAQRLDCPVLQASTSEVYGDPAMHPQSEHYCGNVNPIGPRACYSEGKRFAEALFCDYARRYHTPIAIARIFNTYGPRMHMDDGRVIPTFIAQALQNKPLTIYGDGTQTRSFCYVDDMVDGLVQLMDSDIEAPVNLGNPHEISVLALAQRIKELTESTSPFEFKPLPQDDPYRRCPNIDIAARLGWLPRMTLDDGLIETIRSFTCPVLA